jgi:hypothetical protein
VGESDHGRDRLALVGGRGELPNARDGVAGLGRSNASVVVADCVDEHAGLDSQPSVARWDFLTNHAHVLTCVADDPGIRLRDIAAAVGITEPAAHRILSELVEEGYVLREREGRRNATRSCRSFRCVIPSARGGRWALCSKCSSSRRGRLRLGRGDAQHGRRERVGLVGAVSDAEAGSVVRLNACPALAD